MALQKYTEANLARILGHDYIGALPRKTLYSGTDALDIGLKPATVIPRSSWKETIKKCNDLQIFPYYRQEKSNILDYWNQNGLSYCWAWSLAATVIDTRDLFNLTPKLLAPTTLGWLVNWRNAGYYLDSAIKGCRQRGISDAKYVPDLFNPNPRTFLNGWQADALNQRVLEWWETNRYAETEDFIGQCLAILSTGRPGYAAWYRLAHAMEVVGMFWDESIPYNVVWVIRNSHKEKECITMDGERSIPDEFYGIRSVNLK